MVLADSHRRDCYGERIGELGKGGQGSQEREVREVETAID
jgi:hypothetical protein